VKHNINYVEFYITNVCDFNCIECNRFNNFYFSGQSLWDDYVQTYIKWGNRVDITRIGIIGGEPLLNPTFMDWVNGLSTIWPDAILNIITNGTQLLKYPNIYDDLKKLPNIVFLEISLHNKSRYNTVRHNLNMLFGEMETYEYGVIDILQNWNSIKDISWGNFPIEIFNKNDVKIQFIDNLKSYIIDECKNIHDFDLLHEIMQYSKQHSSLLGKDNIIVEILDNTNFYKSAITYKNNKFELFNNDVNNAYEHCSFKTCNHFMNGKLYHCAPVALIPEFDKQFNINMTFEDRKLINSYKPLTVDCTDDELKQFILDIESKAIPQCKFCPTINDGESIKLASSKEKIKIRGIRND